MQEEMMLLREEFIHKDISEDFTINQSENENSRLSLMYNTEYYHVTIFECRIEFKEFQDRFSRKLSI